MKKSGIYVVVAIIGLGAGIGAGFLINKPKLDQSKLALANLQTQMDEASKLNEQKILLINSDKARLTTELSRVNAELTRFKTEYVRVNTDLVRVTGELQKLKESITPQSPVADQAAIQAKPTANVASSAQPESDASAAKTVVAAGEYVIKDGDNLWKIAADQLGSGIRYKEILALNPGISEKTTLALGSKIKLPAK